MQAQLFGRATDAVVGFVTKENGSSNGPHTLVNISATEEVFLL